MTEKSLSSKRSSIAHNQMTICQSFCFYFLMTKLQTYRQRKFYFNLDCYCICTSILSAESKFLIGWEFPAELNNVQDIDPRSIPSKYRDNRLFLKKKEKQTTQELHSQLILNTTSKVNLSITASSKLIETITTAVLQVRFALYDLVS